MIRVVSWNIAKRTKRAQSGRSQPPVRLRHRLARIPRKGDGARPQQSGRMGPERSLPAADRGCNGVRVGAGRSGAAKARKALRRSYFGKFGGAFDGILGDSGWGADVGHGGVGHAVEHPEGTVLAASRGTPLSRLQNSDRLGAAQEHPSQQRRPRTAIGAILMATMVGSALAQPPIRYFRRTSGAFGRTVFREVRPP